MLCAECVAVAQWGDTALQTAEKKHSARVITLLRRQQQLPNIGQPRDIGYTVPASAGTIRPLNIEGSAVSTVISSLLLF